MLTRLDTHRLPSRLWTKHEGLIEAPRRFEILKSNEYSKHEQMSCDSLGFFIKILQLVHIINPIGLKQVQSRTYGRLYETSHSKMFFL